jgi:hypothetical protein
MEWELFCEEQAYACELRAAQLGERARQDWLAMADEWRRVAIEPEPPFIRGLVPPAAESL